jgi:hypothetical protein
MKFRQISKPSHQDASHQVIADVPKAAAAVTTVRELTRVL